MTRGRRPAVCSGHRVPRGQAHGGPFGQLHDPQALTRCAGSGVGWQPGGQHCGHQTRRRAAARRAWCRSTPCACGRRAAQALIDNLPPPMRAGKSQERAGRLLGERDFMDTPFNSRLCLDADPEPAGAQHRRRRRQRSFGAAWPAVGYSTALMIRGFSFNSNDMSLRRPLRHRADALGGPTIWASRSSRGRA